VQHFVTIGELLHKFYWDLDRANLEKISRTMRRFNQKSLIQSVNRWEKVLEGVLGVEKMERVKQVEY
jgi:hypothetical protein